MKMFYFSKNINIEFEKKERKNLNIIVIILAMLISFGGGLLLEHIFNLIPDKEPEIIKKDPVQKFDFGSSEDNEMKSKKTRLID